MDLGIRGRNALVLGSTSGLGYAIAEELLREGTKVVVNGRTDDTTQRASKALGVVGIAADVSQPKEVDLLIDKTLSALGHLDLVVLNSGGPAPGEAKNLDVAGIQKGVNLLLAPHVRIVQRLLPGMKERGWGRIVAIGSTGVQAPLPNLVISSVGRAALAAYLKTLSAEVAGAGVTVNMVHPGRIDTKRVAELDAAKARRESETPEAIRSQSEATIPAGRYGRPDEFAAAVVFLCSERASYITGTQIRVDGGLVRSY